MVPGAASLSALTSSVLVWHFSRIHKWSAVVSDRSPTRWPAATAGLPLCLLVRSRNCESRHMRCVELPLQAGSREAEWQAGNAQVSC